MELLIPLGAIFGAILIGALAQARASFWWRVRP